MLAGKYEETRIRELQPRLSIDPITGHIRCREGVLRVLYMAGGTIPDRGYFHLRVRDSGSKIGELDEEFVWERSIGDVFAFGTQHWRITSIDHQNVEVAPAPGPAFMAPFWKADLSGRDFHLSERIGLTLEKIDGQMESGDVLRLLEEEYFMDGAPAERLLDILHEQKRITGEGLPHRYRIVAEHLPGLENRPDSRQIVLHLLWGGRVILPLCVALARAWERCHGTRLKLYHDDDCILIILPEGSEETGARDMLTLVTPDNVEGLLRERLELTGMFGARFRENAARALLLPRAGFDRRTPLWLSRLRAKKLLQAVHGYEDFPILTETWRTCLRDEFDMDSLKKLLDEVMQGAIEVKDVRPAAPSPFASEILHWQTHAHMYEDDTPELAGASRLREDILREVVYDSGLRPKIPLRIIEYFTTRLKQLAPGYTPENADALYDWVRERILMPMGEAEALMSAMVRDHAVEADAVLDELFDRIVVVLLPGASERALLALENLPRLLDALFIPGEEGDDRLCDLLAEWFRYEGPVAVTRVQELYGIDETRAEKVIEALVEEQRLIDDFIGEGSQAREICDAVNLERLLRLLRRERKQPLRTLPVSKLPLFLALHQGISMNGMPFGGHGSGEPVAARGDDWAVEARISVLRSSLEQLFGYPGRAESWESTFLPARVPAYTPELLDLLMQRSDLIWFGTGRRRVSFCLLPDLELFPSPPLEGEDGVDRLFPDRRAKYGFQDLLDLTEMGSRELSSRLWDLVWRGAVSNDRFEALRIRVKGGGSTVETPQPLRTGRSRRPGFNRWQLEKPMNGNWYVLDRGGKSPDLLDEADIARDRARQLLSRYGILFRELLQQELPALQWGEMFRALRIMELSGEVLAGYFFEGIPGLQFASKDAFRMLQQELPRDAVYWMNATDPASLCGLKLEGLEQPLPRRVESSYLVFHGKKLVLVLMRKGKEAWFHVLPGDQSIGTYLGIYHVLLKAAANAPALVRVERINETPAVESPYLPQMLEFGFTRGHRDLLLRRGYR